MRNENIISYKFTRRSLLLAGGKALLLSFLAARIYYLQIIDSDKYKLLSDKNRIRIISSPPIRGRIIDINGHSLAMNKTFYRAVFNPTSNADPKTSIVRLLEILTLQPQEKEYIKDKINKSSITSKILIIDNLSWKDLAKIELNNADLPGIEIEIGQTRIYPYHENCCHITGYVGTITKKDIQQYPLLNNAEFKIGKNGLELKLEEQLRGKVGVKKLEVDAYGQIVRDLAREPSQAGEDIRLTIDINIQEKLSELLSKNGGAGTIIDIHTGNVIALASTPGFDPNKFSGGISAKYWQKLIRDYRTPLLNKVLSPYPPGSTFKLVTALAALEYGISPSTIFNCNGHFMVGNHKFHCWKKTGHGNMTMNEAIPQSCNVYYYNLAKQIGFEKIAQMAKSLGLGMITEIEIPYEKEGLIPDKAWKKNKYKQEWSLGDTINCSIGQGYCLTSPLQLAIMVARIVSGKQIKPHILFNNILDRDNFPPFNNLNIKKQNLDIIKKGMFNAVNSNFGTARASKLNSSNFTMAGKTGTAQVISKKNSNDDLSKISTKWEKRNHGIFVGFAPYDNPRYAISIIAEHGGGGASSAAPIAQNIFDYIFTLNNQS
jgi:penicillin-binding protein 2